MFLKILTWPSTLFCFWQYVYKVICIIPYSLRNHSTWVIIAINCFCFEYIPLLPKQTSIYDRFDDVFVPSEGSLFLVSVNLKIKPLKPVNSNLLLRRRYTYVGICSIIIEDIIDILYSFKEIYSNPNFITSNQSYFLSTIAPI